MAMGWSNLKLEIPALARAAAICANLHEFLFDV
jgi:hypothetical protein